MSEQLTPEQAAAAARELLNDRVKVVEQLAALQVQIARTRDQLTQLERDEAKAFRNAEQAGWTKAELRKAGLKIPQRRTPGRPRAAKSSTGQQSG